LDSIHITYEQGKVRDFHRGIAVKDVISAIYEKESSNVVAVFLNDQMVDESRIVDEDANLRAVFLNTDEGISVFWHSASHILAQAVKSLFPETKLAIGPSIANGFYYDFQRDIPFRAEDLPVIEKRMMEIIAQDQPFIRKTLSKKDALAFFRSMGETFKIELIEGIPADDVTIYTNGSFSDLCRGPHVPSTGHIRFFKLLNVAGAYWRGDERNAVLNRIYGTAYPKKDQLDERLIALEEAAKRDHRRLGKELDLFSFHTEGPGFPFWHSNGLILIHEIERYMRDVLTRRGYREIKTPLILNEELWHRSGHWDHYKENMYFTTIEDHPYAVKPMNCPGGLLVYKNDLHSYRDLPIKLAEMGLVHRHEKSGVLHGLFRVRQFTQDDAHVFCMPEQMEREIIQLIELVQEVYGTFGFHDTQVELSTRPAKSIGTDEMWKKAETALSNALRTKSIDFAINEGEGAFYGPKIDYHIKDSLGRFWQCGTIQVDFSMPERFELEYVGADNTRHRPVMIHRAILGSMERFIGILIEHYGGAFPVWLAPVQCVVCPITDAQSDCGQKIAEILQSHSIRVKLDTRNEKVGYKIREAESLKIPFMIIVGKKEMAENTVSVRKRKEGDIGSMTVQALLDQMKKSIDGRTDH
jgi:threonyl-tRNA synthetase